MKVEAVKVENGFLIPFNDTLKNVDRDKILLQVEIIDSSKIEDGYAFLEEMIGCCESNRTDASIKHDEIVYKTRPGK